VFTHYDFLFPSKQKVWILFFVWLKWKNFEVTYKIKMTQGFHFRGSHQMTWHNTKKWKGQNST
jgi:hypothetical protein